MAKKKSSSLFLEPYNLFVIIGQSIALFCSSALKAFKEIRMESEDVPADIKGKAAYAELSKQFDNPEFEKNWRTFLLRALCIEVLLFLLAIGHAAYGNILISLQLLVISLACIVVFGYKPWIRRNRRVVSFMMYLRKELWKDPGSMALWMNLKDKQ